jgi:CheY-like chemotaxis protein
MWNLLTNAVKFTPKGGRIQIMMRRINSSVEIRVSDNGQGISADFLPYIFERFQQQDKTKSRRHGGLGLGLAIIYRIVELHGGSIKAESAGVGSGAAFTVSLPVTAFQRKKENDADKIPAAILPDDGRLSPPDPTRLSGFNILIVDDAADAREMIGFILTEQGANVTTASTVSEAVEKFESSAPDLVISDIEMPDEDGFSLIKKLNDFNKRQKRKIPAIALTAHAGSSERLKVLSAGYRMHLAKPVEPEELLTIVTNFAHWNGDN